MAKRKKSKKSSDNSIDSIFFTSFIGELVHVICRPLPGQEKVVGLEGILMDTDEVYYYLSDDGVEVSRAVNKIDVMTIDIVKNEDQYAQLLNNVPVDKNSAN